MVCDGPGQPLHFALTPGQAGDAQQADKGYDSDAWLAYVASLGAVGVILGRKNRKQQREIDRELYKERNRVEGFIDWIKYYRRVATRYEKRGRNYLALLHLVSALAWLQ